MRRIQIGDYVEDVIERSDYPMDKVREILGRERIGVIGYGPQGHGQSLNCRDNGIDVVVGQRRGGNGWKKAVEDGWQFEEIADLGVRRGQVGIDGFGAAVDPHHRHAGTARALNVFELLVAHIDALGRIGLELVEDDLKQTGFRFVTLAAF